MALYNKDTVRTVTQVIAFPKFVRGDDECHFDDLEDTSQVYNSIFISAMRKLSPAYNEYVLMLRQADKAFSQYYQQKINRKLED